jgi:hypothetical protein
MDIRARDIIIVKFTKVIYNFEFEKRVYSNVEQNFIIVELGRVEQS